MFTWNLVSKLQKESKIMSQRLSEFRLHRKVTNPAHIIGFLSQWKMYLEQMPDREGGKYYKGKKIDTTIIEKVHVNASWTEWTTNIWLRCHRNNWASFMNSCNLQRRFGLLRDHELLHIYVWALTQSLSSLQWKLIHASINDSIILIDSLHSRISELRIWSCMKLLACLCSVADKVCLDTKNLPFVRFDLMEVYKKESGEGVLGIMRPKRVKLRYNTKIRYHHPATQWRQQQATTSIKEKHVHMITWTTYHVSNRCEQANSWYFGRFSFLKLRPSLPRVRHWLDSPLFTRNCWKLKLVKVMRPSLLSSHAVYF